MTRKNFVLEIGTGTDLRGGDATKAAVRAVSNAIHNGSLYVLDFVPNFDQVYVDVTVAVPYHETVRQEEVLEVLPVGQKTIQVVAGGLAAPYRGGEGDEILIATAVVRVSIEV